MADDPPPESPDPQSPPAPKLERLQPFLRLTIFIFAAPVSTIFCAIPSEMWVGPGYGTIYPGAIVGILAVSLLMVRFADRRSIGSFGLPFNLWALRDLAIGIVIPAVQLAVIFAAEWSMEWVHIVSFDGNARIFRLALCRWVFVALFEELTNRGYFFQCLDRVGGRRFGPILAIAITSVLFGQAHGGNPHSSGVAVAFLAISGAEYAVAYLVTRRFWLPIGMHFAWNMIEGTVLGFPVSGSPRPSFLVITQSGPVAWTGGEFGPEAGYLSPILSLIDVGMMLWLSRLGFWKPGLSPQEAETVADMTTVG